MENQITKIFESILDFDRKAVGIKFLLSESEYDKCDSFEHKNGLAYCTAVRNASNGMSYKMDAEHASCIAASRALGLIPVSDEVSSGSRHAKLGVYKDLCISKSVANDMVYCKHICKGVEIKPLESYVTYLPDIVIVVTTPFNAMRIIQGYAYNFGQLKNIKMAGMCAICQECTSYPFETNSMNISMLCSGTRCVAQWNENELGIGFPYHYFESIVNGLINTINPMENNKNKEKIISNLQDNSLKNVLDIKLNANYYKNAYGTPIQLKRK
ncbi:DUF169 domain-containing protein [Acetoanaerobium noterae]|uniref:DUF169 domain-containing protein n=1 Tax=Acetoanaerobium noterae TaxID=745369 RepID=UPI0033429BE9